MTTASERARGSLCELTEQECWELIVTTTVGRVGFAGPEGQQLIPVNFALIDGDIFFRTIPGHVLDSLSLGETEVAFGVDHHDSVHREGWNVTVHGKASGVEDRATISKVLGHERLRPWAGGIRSSVIRLSPRSIAGRRVSGH